MHWQNIRDGILATLVLRYEEDSHQFVTLSRQTLDSSWAREAVAELRNEGFVEEQLRGGDSTHRSGLQEIQNYASVRLCKLNRCKFLKGLPRVSVCSAEH
jgi:hypothetical protein